MIDTSIQRVKISQVIENQLPEFVQADNPLFVEFMKQYMFHKNIKVVRLILVKILIDIQNYRRMSAQRLQSTLACPQTLNHTLLQSTLTPQKVGQRSMVS